MPLPSPLRPLTAVLSLGLLAATGYGWAESRTPAPDEGVNVLVVGSDSREGLTDEQKARWHAGGAACNCADVIMVVHLSADGRRAGVVSLPRDSYVRFAPHRHGGSMSTHRGKINATLAHGGHDLVRRTVERATGLEIDHYLHTGLAGFMEAIDELGGATVCPRRRLRDSHTGIDLAPGTHHLGGGPALQYVRTRHSGYGDIDRVRRQQHLVAGIADEKLGDGTLGDEDSLRALVAGLAPHLRPGPSTDVIDMVRLGWEARRLPMSGIESATVPVTSIGHPTQDWGSTVKWDEARAAKLFAALDADEPMRPADDRDPDHGADWTGRVTSGSEMDCR